MRIPPRRCRTPFTKPRAKGVGDSYIAYSLPRNACAVSCRRLRSLDLSQCKLLTDVAVDSVRHARCASATVYACIEWCARCRGPYCTAESDAPLPFAAPTFHRMGQLTVCFAPDLLPATAAEDPPNRTRRWAQRPSHAAARAALCAAAGTRCAVLCKLRSAPQLLTRRGSAAGAPTVRADRPGVGCGIHLDWRRGDRCACATLLAAA